MPLKNKIQGEILLCRNQIERFQAETGLKNIEISLVVNCLDFYAKELETKDADKLEAAIKKNFRLIQVLFLDFITADVGFLNDSLFLKQIKHLKKYLNDNQYSFKAKALEGVLEYYFSLCAKRRAREGRLTGLDPNLKKLIVRGQYLKERISAELKDIDILLLSINELLDNLTRLQDSYILTHIGKYREAQRGLKEIQQHLKTAHEAPFEKQHLPEQLENGYALLRKAEAQVQIINDIQALTDARIEERNNPHQLAPLKKELEEVLVKYIEVQDTLQGLCNNDPTFPQTPMLPDGATILLKERKALLSELTVLQSLSRHTLLEHEGKPFVLQAHYIKAKIKFLNDNLLKCLALKNRFIENQNNLNALLKVFNQDIARLIANINSAINDCAEEMGRFFKHPAYAGIMAGHISKAEEEFKNIKKRVEWAVKNFHFYPQELKKQEGWIRSLIEAKIRRPLKEIILAINRQRLNALQRSIIDLNNQVPPLKLISDEMFRRSLAKVELAIDTFSSRPLSFAMLCSLENKMDTFREAVEVFKRTKHRELTEEAQTVAGIIITLVMKITAIQGGNIHDPRIGILQQLEMKLKEHLQNYLLEEEPNRVEFIKKILAIIHSTREDHNNVQTLSRRMKNLLHYFVELLLQPLNSLLQKMKREPFFCHFFVRKTEILVGEMIEPAQQKLYQLSIETELSEAAKPGKRI
jgi:hypothetical protein